MTLFAAGHPALSFLNTTFTPQGVTHELIGDGPAFAHWLVESELLVSLSPAQLTRRLGAPALAEAAAKARELRDWSAGWLDRWRLDPTLGLDNELRQLNRSLAHASSYRQLVVAEQALTLAEHNRIDGPQQLTALLVAQIAHLITNEEPSLVKRCAGSECTLWFLDRTKAHRRAFCSATGCGNRAKVAAFRQRQRSE